jgi:hypothetical protein
MRCCDVERLWDEMREGIEPRREHVLAHLRGCPECQEIYRENEGIAYCLTCLPPVEPPQSLFPKILEHITTTVKIVIPDSLVTLESPIGKLYVAFRHSGITAVALDRGEGDEAVVTRLQRRLGRGLIPSQVPQWVADTVAAYFRTHTTDLERIARQRRFRPARCVRTAGSRERSANRPLYVRSAVRWRATRWHCSIRAIASSTPTGRFINMRTASRSRLVCSRWKAIRLPALRWPQALRRADHPCARQESLKTRRETRPHNTSAAPSDVDKRRLTGGQEEVVIVSSDSPTNRFTMIGGLRT